MLREGGGWLLDYAAGRFPLLARVRPNRVPGPERLRRAFESLGGSFLKFGQMLALQPDILSIEYCNALFNLLDRVSPFPYADVERTFVEEFGRPPDRIFDSIDRVPLAAASIGQVHVASLNGRKLAVKVQRPSVQTDFMGDIRLMTLGISIIRRFRLRSLHWMIEPMSEFVAWTREELDYRVEARYMRQLRENARDNPHEHVPEVLDEFTTARTLVMEFLTGFTVLGYLRALEDGDAAVIDSLEQSGFDSHAVASHIIDNFLGDVFLHGLFHADLHPANLMILPGSRVGYIDFGITGSISAYSRQNLVALTLAYTRGDLAAMADAFFRVSTFAPDSNVDRFHRGLARDAKRWYVNDGGELHIRKNFTLVMLDMLRLSRETGVWPERDVIKYIRSAIAIDGLITRFAPTFDVGRHLQESCDRYLRWNVRRSLLRFDQLLGRMAPLTKMLRDGAPRMAQAISRMSVDAHGGPAGRRAPAAPPRQRMLWLAAFVAALCFGMTLDPANARLGLNLFTSELALTVAGFGLLVETVRKLPGGGQGNA